MVKLTRKKLTAQVSFDKAYARRYFQTDYYRAQALNDKSHEIIQRAKKRLQTSPKRSVTRLIAAWRYHASQALAVKSTKIGVAMRNIYVKERYRVQTNKDPRTHYYTKLISLVSNPMDTTLSL